MAKLLTIAAALIAFLLGAWVSGVRPAAPLAWWDGSARDEPSLVQVPVGDSSGRTAAVATDDGLALLAGLGAPPRDEAELERLVEGIRALPRGELALAAGAEHRFRESALVRSLQDLSGPWVVPALGALAEGERDPLVKAVLVAGFAGEPRRARYTDPRYPPHLERLLAQLDRAAHDPFEVAQDVVMASYFSSLAQGSDFAPQMAGVLASSDNPQLLIQGHLLLNGSASGRAYLRTSLFGHPHRDGRMGAIEGLRTAAALGRISPQESASLFTDVLQAEADPRNRFLALEALAVTGGADGEQSLRRMVLDPEEPLRGPAMVLLAGQLPPREALLLMEGALLEEGMEQEVRGELYSALARISGPEGPARVLLAAADAGLSLEERVTALSALGSASAGAELAAGLLELSAGEHPPEVRAQALQVLVERTEGAPPVDLWALAREDPSPLVRARALELAAFAPEADAAAQLMERAELDPDEGVRASALAALVARARYEGGGEELERLLEQAEGRAQDARVAGRLAQARAELTTPDPLRARVELEGGARFWREIGRHLEGADARAAELEARLLERRARATGEQTPLRPPALSDPRSRRGPR